MGFLCGGLAVGGLANNDYQRQEVSSLETYVGTAGYASMDGVKAGAAFCMVPYVAEAGVAMAAPYGIPIAGPLFTSEMLVDSAVVVGYGVTFNNMAVKINDSLATITGHNIMQNGMGQETYQQFKDVTQIGSDTIFMIGVPVVLDTYMRNI